MSRPLFHGRIERALFIGFWGAVVVLLLHALLPAPTPTTSAAPPVNDFATNYRAILSRCHESTFERAQRLGIPLAHAEALFLNLCVQAALEAQEQRAR